MASWPICPRTKKNNATPTQGAQRKTTVNGNMDDSTFLRWWLNILTNTQTGPTKHRLLARLFPFKHHQPSKGRSKKDSPIFAGGDPNSPFFSFFFWGAGGLTHFFFGGGGGRLRRSASPAPGARRPPLPASGLSFWPPGCPSSAAAPGPPRAPAAPSGGLGAKSGERAARVSEQTKRARRGECQSGGEKKKKKLRSTNKKEEARLKKKSWKKVQGEPLL